MVRLLFVLLIATVALPTAAFAKTVNHSSPSQVLSIEISDEGRWPGYSLSRFGETVVEPSRIGFAFREAPWLHKALTIKSVETRSVDQSWEQPWGETRTVRNTYEEVRVTFEDSTGKRGFDFVARLYDEGVGFRYEVAADADFSSRSVTDELTEFNFADNGTAWWIPGRQWNRYEYLYHTTKLSEVGLAHTPITWETANGLFISVHEAALVDYAGMSLQHIEGTRFKADLAPWSDGDLVKTTGAFTTPWRTLQIADSAAGLVESYLILNLNEPNKLGDVSWVEPGKYAGVWWEMHLAQKTWGSGDKHGATNANVKKHIDFAAKYGFKGVLVEGWNLGWDGSWYDNGEIFDFTKSYPDFDLEMLGKYGAERGVRIVGHHETSGAVSHYEKQMDASFRLLSENGVRQVKTGYVTDAGEILRITESGERRLEHHDGQWMQRHHLRVLEAAAKYKISINSHEPVKDTGLRRTYPNWIAREGARGSEYDAWGSPVNSPEHTAILPFTRMLSGPMDYTPGIFDVTYQTMKSVNPDGSERGTRMETTLAKQLAFYVTIYSPIQMVPDLPEHYEARMDAFQFIRDVPTDWETSKVLTAAVGDHYTVARKERGGNDWYLGAVTDEDGRLLNVDLGFLDEGVSYTAQIYRDGDAAHWVTNPYDFKYEEQQVTSRSSMALRLAAGGGIAVRFKANPAAGAGRPGGT